MQRLPEIEHDVVRSIDNVIDASLPYRFQKVFEPFGRGSYFHTADVSCNVTRAKGRLLYLDRYGIGRLQRDRVAKRIEFHWHSQNGRQFFCDSAMTEAIVSAIRCDLHIKDAVLDTLDLECMEREDFTKRVRIR